MSRESRIDHFSRSLHERTTITDLGPAPALVVHPDGERPAPLLLWLHGRTVSKEIDSARYLRLIRSGVAVAAVDLPGHGERYDTDLQDKRGLPELLRQALGEVDPILAALRAPPWDSLVDSGRLAMGGMSAGGMVTLRRLCDPHPFRCAAVESSAGDFQAAAETREDQWLAGGMRDLDPSLHLDAWRPLPLLALHSEQDELAPVAGMTSFFAKLLPRYRAAGEEDWLRLRTWPETGATKEHAGFGRFAGQARKLLLGFLAEHLL